MRKIIFKVIKWILLVLILILAVIVVCNYACKRNEAGKVKDAYGQSVEVAGKNDGIPMISNIVSLNYDMAIFQKIKIGD